MNENQSSGPPNMEDRVRSGVRTVGQGLKDLAVPCLKQVIELLEAGLRKAKELVQEAEAQPREETAPAPTSDSPEPAPVKTAESQREDKPGKGAEAKPEDPVKNAVATEGTGVQPTPAENGEACGAADPQINLDLLRSTATQARNAHEEKDQQRARRQTEERERLAHEQAAVIIASIPTMALMAAGRGCDQLTVIQRLGGWKPEELGGRDKLVYDWCLKAGLRPTIEYCSDYGEGGSCDLVIHWD
jgi:hypothetical protein